LALIHKCDNTNKCTRSTLRVTCRPKAPEARKIFLAIKYTQRVTFFRGKVARACFFQGAAVFDVIIWVWSAALVSIAATRRHGALRSRARAALWANQLDIAMVLVFICPGDQHVYVRRPCAPDARNCSSTVSGSGVSKAGGKRAFPRQWPGELLKSSATSLFTLGARNVSNLTIVAWV
jgi:hypothetical protein